jgi:hypothetical protein
MGTYGVAMAALVGTIAAASAPVETEGGLARERTASITTFAGTGEAGYAGDGGLATAARLDQPFGVVRGLDRALYMCDTGNHAIRRVARDGTISTVAGTGKAGYSGDGGAATKAALNEPYEVRFDRRGNMFFVERLNHVVRRVDARSGTISTVAGTGTAGYSGDGGPGPQAQMRQRAQL